MKRINNNSKLIKGKYLIAILVCVLSLSVGFAAFSNDLTIEGIAATIRIRRDIRISSLSIVDSKNAVVNHSDYNVNEVLLGVDLKNADSYVTLDVGITNLGNVEQGLVDIFNLPSALDYEIVDGYKLGDPLCNNDKCTNGAVTSIKVKIKYKNDSTYDSSNTTYSIINKYEFRNFFNVTFNDNYLEYLGTNKPNKVITNGDYVCDVHDIDLFHTVITEEGRILESGTDYKIIDDKLYVYNVEGDINIKALEYIYEEEDIHNGFVIKTKWITEDSVEIELNGTTTSNLYIRIRQGDTTIKTLGPQLYDATYAANPLFVTGDNVFIDYKFLGGTYKLNGAFTIKYRITDASCTAVDYASLIANHSKQNFTFNQDARVEGVALRDIAQLSTYITSGSTFNNVKIVVTYGKTN